MAKARQRASVVCEAQGHLLLVRLRDPVSGAEALYPPGGGVEPGEPPHETARRETLEETGVRVRVDPDLHLVERYPFTWAGTAYDVTTHYFAAHPEDELDPTLALPRTIDADYNLGAAWVPTEAALRALAVHPAIGDAVARLLVRMRAAR